MNKSVNQDKFIEKFFDILESIDTDKLEKFLGKVKNHKYFEKKYTKLLQETKWKTDRERAIFILTEMTRERSTCNAIIVLLKGSGHSKAAEILNEINQSLEPLPLSATPEIDVTQVHFPKKALSMCYPLLKKPRGKCVIINNVEDQQVPDYKDFSREIFFKPKGLINETKRLQNVFEQLYFDVIVKTKLSANQIQVQLKNIRDEQLSKEDEAFVLFIISHGEEDRILGSIACEYLRQMSFHLVKPTDQNAIKEIKADMVHKEDIIEIFSEKQCPKLKNKPKMHFFICCRNKITNSSDQGTTDDKTVSETSALANKFVDKRGNTQKESAPAQSQQYECIQIQKEPDTVPSFDTFVCYTSAKGFMTFYNNEWGMSFFTQALTLSIAQYACDETLTQIMARTLQRLEGIYKEKKDKEKWNFGNFAIEVRRLAMKKDLYFNPGISE